MALSSLYAHHSRYDLSAKSAKDNRNTDKEEFASYLGRRTQSLTGHYRKKNPNDLQNRYFTLPVGNSSAGKKSLGSFDDIRLSPPSGSQFVESAGDVAAVVSDDSFNIDTLLEQIKEKGITNNLLKSTLKDMTVTEFYKFVEDFIADVEGTVDKEPTASLSRGRKAIYATVLILTGLGGSSSVLGLLPLGADATDQERAIGISQFILAISFSHGVPYVNAMHNLVSHLDNQLTDYFQARRDDGLLSSVWSDIKQGVLNTRWQSAVPTTLALLFAAYAPLLDAVNSRAGGINLISGGDPSRMGAGVVVGNFLMCCNWMAGSALLGSMTKSLFTGYTEDIHLLIHGASSERKDVERLVQVLRKMMIASVVNPNGPVGAERLQLIACSEFSGDDCLLKELLESADSVLTLVPGLKLLLDEMEGGSKEKLAHIKSTLEEQQGEAVAGLAAGLFTELSGLLKSPKLCTKVRKQFRCETVAYSNSQVRLAAGCRLLIRSAVTIAAGSCIAVTVATPMVTNYYKTFMESPTQPVDCPELQNISGGIEPFGPQFKMGLVAYLLQGISLSDGVIKLIELALIPLGVFSMFMSERDLESVRLCCKALIRDFPEAAAVCGAICGAVIGWILSSAGAKFQEYLELLDCNIGAPDTVLAWAGENAPMITYILMVGTIGHLGVSSFDSVFGKLGLGQNSRCRGTAPGAATLKTEGENESQED